MKPCSVDGCSSPSSSRGWCGKHYQRWFRNGDPLVTRRRPTNGLSTEERFWHYVEKGAECWTWSGKINTHGYGAFWGGVGRGETLAHRFAYELLIGPIPEGLHVDHLCRNRACCNPAHLEAVTCRTNVLRGVGLAALNAAKTHCIRGHEFTTENTYHPPGSPWRRICLTCQRERDSRREWSLVRRTTA